MEQLIFQVKGSSSNTYELTFIKDGDSLTALCTCPAGQFGGLCKHRVAIIDGKSESVSSYTRRSGYENYRVGGRHGRRDSAGRTSRR